MKGKTIVFCLPGRGCSFTFLKNFVQLCFDMVQNGMSIQISQDYHLWLTLHVVSVWEQMYFVDLSKYLGMVVEYDYQLWIDSDIVFNTEKFWQLCDIVADAEGKEKEIVAGWYATEDGQTTSVAHWLEEDEFRNNGGVMNHETVNLSVSVSYFTVDYTGFGWVLIKKGVFENLEYPWFALRCKSLRVVGHVWRGCLILS